MATTVKKFGQSSTSKNKKETTAQKVHESLHIAKYTKLVPFDLSKLQVSKNNSRDTTFLVRYIPDNTLEDMKQLIIDEHNHLAGNDVAINDYLNNHINEFTDPKSSKYVPISKNATITQFKKENLTPNGILEQYDNELEGIFIGKSLLTYHFSSAHLNKMAEEFVSDIKRLAGVLAAGRTYQDDITVFENGSWKLITAGFLRYTASYFFYGSNHVIYVKMLDKDTNPNVSADEYIYTENNSKISESGWETFMMRHRVYQQNCDKTATETDMMALLSLSRKHYYNQLPMLRSTVVYDAIVKKEITHLSFNKVVTILKRLDTSKVALPETIDSLVEFLEQTISKNEKPEFNEQLARDVFIEQEYHKLTSMLDKANFSENDVKNENTLAKAIAKLFINN